ncbi:MAG: Uma2 family endonuclease [Bryobacteraceae bacterium]
MQTTTHPITYEESLRMPENKLEEILDGESRIMPPPATGHHLFVRKLSQELERVFPGHDVCRDPCGLGICREPLRYRIPDVSVYPENAIIPGEPYIWATPILVAECLSPSNRKGKTEELLADYELIGVPEVWFFYPEKRLFQKYVLEQGKLRLKENAEPGSIARDDLWAAFHGA